VHKSYGNTAPASPSDLPRTGARSVPLQGRKRKDAGAFHQSSKYQIEYGDTGLFLRFPKHWKAPQQGPGERRFSYCMFERPDPIGRDAKPRNPYRLERIRSTKKWHQDWNNRTDPRGATSTIPSYSALTDPYCAKYCTSLYKKKAWKDEAKAPEESDHDFYKRREEQASNFYQRARRRSIELIEAVAGKHKEHTESSRRKSVVDMGIDVGPYGPNTQSASAPPGTGSTSMTHLDAAAAAAAWFEHQDVSAGDVYRQPTPDFENGPPKLNRRNRRGRRPSAVAEEGLGDTVNIDASDLDISRMATY